MRPNKVGLLANEMSGRPQAVQALARDKLHVAIFLQIKIVFKSNSKKLISDEKKRLIMRGVLHKKLKRGLIQYF